MTRNPAVILFDGYGTPVAKLEGDIIFENQPALIFAGEDEDGLVRFVNVASSTGAIKTASVGQREPEGEYYFGSSLIAGTAATQNLVSLENPVGSGRNIYLNRVVVNGTIGDKFTTPFVYSVTRTAGLPTGGTTQTAQLRSTSDAAPIGVIRTAPIATAATGALWTGSPGLFDKGAFFQSLVESVATFEEKKEVIIAPGEAILITAGPNAITWSHWVNLHWNEVLNG